MQVHNTISPQLSLPAQIIEKTAELREHREELQKINNENTQRIQEDINISSITGLGGSLNIEA